MKKITIFILYALPVLLAFSCQPRGEWQNVASLNNDKKCDTLATRCQTNHQGEHLLQQCDVYMDNDTLVIHFPAELPAYWGGLELKIHNGQFNARFSGVPFEPIELSFETVRQKLRLNKETYAIGDTLCGYCDFTFKEINTETQQSSTFYWKGEISEIVRSKKIDPFKQENYMTFDLPTALHEFGEPLSQEFLTTMHLHEFRIELLNFFQASDSIAVKEITWDLGPIQNGVYTEEKRLTIWYARANDKHLARKDGYLNLPAIWESNKNDNRWLPVDDCEWHTGMQF